MRMSDQGGAPIDHSEGGEKEAPVEPIHIVLADDHAVVRSGLRMLLDGESDFEVVAEAATSKAPGATYGAIIRMYSCSI